jgi:hypothetical protein
MSLFFSPSAHELTLRPFCHMPLPCATTANEQSSSNSDDPEYGTKQNVQQSSAGNYADYQDDSTSSGGYGGDPFSRSAQTGGDDAQSRGQFGGDAKQESSSAYRTSDSQGHSRSGSDYGGGSGATTPFEQKTGGFSGRFLAESRRGEADASRRI